MDRPLVKSVICAGYWNHAVLVWACTVIPGRADPVWLASVPLTVTVASGRAIVGVIPVMEMASACAVAALVPAARWLNFTGGRPRGRDPREERAGNGEEDSGQRAQGTNDGAHGLHVMAVRYKGLG